MYLDIGTMPSRSTTAWSLIHPHAHTRTFSLSLSRLMEYMPMIMVYSANIYTHNKTEKFQLPTTNSTGVTEFQKWRTSPL